MPVSRFQKHDLPSCETREDIQFYGRIDVVLYRTLLVLHWMWCCLSTVLVACKLRYADTVGYHTDEAGRCLALLRFASRSVPRCINCRYMFDFYLVCVCPYATLSRRLGHRSKEPSHTQRHDQGDRHANPCFLPDLLVLSFLYLAQFLEPSGIPRVPHHSVSKS